MYSLSCLCICLLSRDSAQFTHVDENQNEGFMQDDDEETPSQLLRSCERLITQQPKTSSRQYSANVQDTSKQPTPKKVTFPHNLVSEPDYDDFCEDVEDRQEIFTQIPTTR